MDITMIGKIYELNGMIKSLIDVVEYDNNFNHPLIDRIDEKMNDIVNSLENSRKDSVPSDAMKC